MSETLANGPNLRKREFAGTRCEVKFLNLLQLHRGSKQRSLAKGALLQTPLGSSGTTEGRK